MARLRLSLRAKVLLASAVLLVIPYVGYRYVQEMENFLREGLESSVLGAARALAGALHDRVDLLAGYAAASRSPADEIFVHPLAYPMQVDGYAGDWQEYRQNLKPVGPGRSAGSFSARYLAGHHQGYLYLLLEVADPRVSYRRPGHPRVLPGDFVDLRIGERPQGARRYRLSPISPGWLSVHVVTERSAEAPLRQREPRIWAQWQPREDGYTVEVRIPEMLVGGYMAVDVADVGHEHGRVKARLSTAGDDGAGLPGRLVFPSPEIAGIIRGLGRTPGRRIYVVDPRGRVLASGGSLATEPPKVDINPLFALLLRPPPADLFEEQPVAGELKGPEVASALAGNRAARWKTTATPDVFVVSAAHPVWIGEQVAGAVVVEQTSLGIQTVRRRALADLFTNTLVVFSVAGLLLILFANRVSRRLARLRDEAERAIDAHGRVVGRVSGSAAGDEIGDLGRSFSALMRRLRQYNHYLEHLARRLSHELRTPMAVIRSSLDALAMRDADPESEKFVTRAKEGLTRLETMIVRMSEATRLEHAMQSAEREHFDLDRMLAASVDGYRQTWPETRMRYTGPGVPCVINGVPDLIAQMLDKLVSNARDFGDPGSQIEVRLGVHAQRPVLEVVNDGPPLPPDMASTLFNSMVSMRGDGKSAEPHLGLGLYIVRLIAEFHGAVAEARNRRDGRGVVIRVGFPGKAASGKAALRHARASKGK